MKSPDQKVGALVAYYGRLLCNSLHDGDLLAILAQSLKLDATVLQCKQGVVLADAHVHAGVNVSTALTDQDVASQNKLTIAALDAQTLSHRVTAVTSGANALLMCEELQSDMKH